LLRNSWHEGISEFKEFLKAERIPSEFSSQMEYLSWVSVG